MLHPSPARWLAVPVALMALAAAAQTAPPAMPAAAASAPPYQSSFEGYQAFRDEKPVAWKEANEVVHQRGGGMAYAQEAAEPAQAKPHAMPMPMPKKDQP